MRERKSVDEDEGVREEGIFCEASRVPDAVESAVTCKVNDLNDLATPIR